MGTAHNTRRHIETLLLGKYAHRDYSFAHFDAYTTIDQASDKATGAHGIQSIMLIYGLLVVRMTQAEFDGALYLGIINKAQGKPFID